MSAKLVLETGVVVDMVITDNKRIIMDLAKIILENSPSRYKNKRIEYIKKTIMHWLPNISEHEMEEIFLQSIYDYWAYGIKIEEEFFFGLLNKSHEEKKEYVTYMEHIIYAYYLNNKKNRDLLYHKYKTYECFKEYYKRDMILLDGNGDEYLKFKEFVQKHPQFVVKPIDAHMAEGVHKEELKDTSEVSVLNLFEKICSEAKISKEVYTAKVNGCVLEEIFCQDERMAAIHPGGVNDVRCTTVKVNGKVHVFYPWLSTGRGGRFVTPYTGGRIVSGIDVKTGIVDTKGITQLGEVFDVHPDTKINYIGFQIPEYDKLIEIVTELANKLPDINYVGWDMVFTKRGWAVQEANFAGEPSWQMLYGYGTKKEFEDLIGWRLTEEFWWQEQVWKDSVSSIR